MMRHKDFVAFILSHGRASRVITYKKLRDCGYTGRIVIVIDNEDDSAPKYFETFGADNVVIFDKAAIAGTFDEGMPGDRRTIVYARNACFDIARQLGYRYFIELDDDYTAFNWRFDHRLRYINKDSAIRNLDAVFDIMLDFYCSTPIKLIAMAQGGDFIGGSEGTLGKKLCTRRKAMNSFICDTERPFTFLGRINEDVNTYTRNTSTGDIFMQIHSVYLNQKQTQSNGGGDDRRISRFRHISEIVFLDYVYAVISQNLADGQRAFGKCKAFASSYRVEQYRSQNHKRAV